MGRTTHAMKWLLFVAFALFALSHSSELLDLNPDDVSTPDNTARDVDFMIHKPTQEKTLGESQEKKKAVLNDAKETPQKKTVEKKDTKKPQDTKLLGGATVPKLLGEATASFAAWGRRRRRRYVRRRRRRRWMGSRREMGQKQAVRQKVERINKAKLRAERSGKERLGKERSGKEKNRRERTKKLQENVARKGGT